MCVFKENLGEKEIDCYFSKMDLVDTIPSDNQGLCIFHSVDEKWKKEENFILHVEKLITYFEQDPLQENIFLENIIFSCKIDNLFNYKEFKKDISFNHSRFKEGLAVKSSTFKNLGFDSAVFHEPASFTSLSIKKITLDNAHFKSKLFINDSNFHLDFFMLGTRFDGGLTLSNSIFHSNTFFQNIKTNMDKSINEGIVFKHIQFKQFTTFELSEFNSVVDFKNIIVDSELVFHNTQFNYNEPLPMVSSVNFEQINVKEKARLEFRGSADNKMFGKVQDVSFFKEEIEGTLFFEHIDFTKFSPLSRERLISATKMENAKVIMGVGCKKYYNRTPLKSIEIGDENQNLVIELCNTFADYFTKNGGFNLGVEFVSKTAFKIDFFYFSDEVISNEKFEAQLQKSEKQMWRLVKIENDNLRTQPPKKNLPSQLINATDTIINLLGLVLKIGSRIPLGLISKDEISHLLNTTIPSNAKTTNGLIVNQIVLFGIKNSQSFQVKKIG